MTAVLRLKHGEFIGASSKVVRASGFSYVELAHSAGVRVPLHSHDDAHFVLVLNGDYETGARGIDPMQSPRPLIFNPPGTTHTDHFRSDAGRFFTISVAPEQFARLSPARAPIQSPVRFGSGEMTTLAMRMLREFRGDDSLREVVLEGLGLELLARAARGVRDERPRHAPAWLKRAVELMHDGCCTSLSVRDVAAEVGVHPYHLARVARTFLGRSPGELLRECRVHRALALLAQTGLSLCDIAATCGYADQSQFTRSLKRVTGTTPASFRRGSRGRMNSVMLGAAHNVSHRQDTARPAP